MSNQDGPPSFPMTPVCVVAGVYLIALADMPYGYYTLTRLITCGVALWLLLKLYALNPNGDGLLWALGGVAVLYNPVIPVYLNSKPLWTVVNLLTLGLFWFSIQVGRRIQSNRELL